MHHRHRILDRDRLRSACLDVDFGAAEARQDQRGAAMHQMAAIELRGDVDGQVEIAQRRLRRLPVGHGGGEIAAHREEYLHFAADHRLQRGDDVMPWRRGGLKPKRRSSRREVPASGLQ